MALARCRVSKLRILLRGRSAAFRRLPPDALFFGPEDIPLEALTYLRRCGAGTAYPRARLGKSRGEGVDRPFFQPDCIQNDASLPLQMWCLCGSGITIGR